MKAMQRSVVRRAARRIWPQTFGAARCAGFTLIELLASLALLGLLAALIIPALNRARESARRSVCTGNLRQLGIAAQLYWDDHDGAAFRYRSASMNNGDVYWFGWLERGAEGLRQFDPARGALFPYLRGRGVEICPALDTRMRAFKRKAAGLAYGYGYNLTLSRPLGEPPVRISSIEAPAAILLLGDAAQVNIFQAPASPSNPLLEEFYYLNAVEPTAHFRHARRAAALYCDGHVDAESAVEGSIDVRMPEQLVGRIAASRFLPP